MPKIESEKIDCLYRPCSRPAPRGKIARTQKSSNSLIRFRCSNSCSLLESDIAGHERLFLAKWYPKAEKKLRKRRFFDTADRHEKLYGRSRLYASAQGRHETGGVLSLFSRLSFDISIKNSVQRSSSDFQGLFRVKIRKMAQGSDDLSTLPLTLLELFVERSKKTPSLKSAGLSTRRFAAYAYFFEVAWRSNLDNHSRDRARTNVGKYQNRTSYTRVSARHHWTRLVLFGTPWLNATGEDRRVEEGFAPLWTFPISGSKTRKSRRWALF